MVVDNPPLKPIIAAPSDRPGTGRSTLDSYYFSFILCAFHYFLYFYFSFFDFILIPGARGPDLTSSFSPLPPPMYIGS